MAWTEIPAMILPGRVTLRKCQFPLKRSCLNLCEPRPAMVLAAWRVILHHAVSRDFSQPRWWQARCVARRSLPFRNLCAPALRAHGTAGDLDAVRNAVTERWSNGQAEGQISRLKTLKRAMYGRAGVALLRARMLPFQPAGFHTI